MKELELYCRVSLLPNSILIKLKSHAHVIVIVKTIGRKVLGRAADKIAQLKVNKFYQRSFIKRRGKIFCSFFLGI